MVLNTSSEVSNLEYAGNGPGMASSTWGSSAGNRELEQGLQRHFLLATKLAVPSTPLHLIARPHLIERLHNVRHCKLLFINAPAGFGKTCLLSTWVRQGGRQVAWISLDENDNDQVQFWNYIIAALKKVHSQICDDMQAQFSAQSPLLAETIPLYLINACMGIKEDITLILDNFEVIHSKAVIDGINLLLNHLPPHIHIVVASRTSVSLPLAKLRAKGQLIEIGASDLRFSTHEVDEFMTLEMGMKLSNDMLVSLETCTEGWSVGLRLVALILQEQVSLPPCIKTSIGSHAYIRDYLEDEIFRQQTADVQAFLLRTSLLNSFCSSLCDAVTNCKDGQAMLEKLERCNLVLISPENENLRYRYHPLFKIFLYEKLQKTYPDSISVLNHRAYIWYSQNGFKIEAIEHALTAGAAENAYHLILEIGEALIEKSEYTTLQRWLDTLPSHMVHSRPHLSLLYAWIYASSGQVIACIPWLESAGSELEGFTIEAQKRPVLSLEQVSRYSKVGAAQSSQQASSKEIVVIKALVASYQEDIALGIEYIYRALDYLPGNNIFLRSLIALNQGFVYALNDQPLLAMQAFTEAYELSQTGEKKTQFIALIALCGLARMQILQGQLRMAAKTYQDAMQFAVEKDGTLQLVAGLVYVGMGKLLQEWNDLDNAACYLQKGIDSYTKARGVRACEGYIALAQVKQAQGQNDQSLHFLQQAEQLVSQYSFPLWIIALVEACQARFWLTRNNKEAAITWAQKLPQEGLSEFENITQVRILIAQDYCEEALDQLETLLKKAQKAGRIGSVIELHILQALVYHKINQIGNAAAILIQALSLAQPENYIRLFVDEGQPMQALLSKIIEDKALLALPDVLLDYAMALLDACTPCVSSNMALIKSNFFEMPSLPLQHLTGREGDILKGIVAGMSNQEIAELLSIQESTVKWHVRNIFSKVNVKNRVQLLTQTRQSKP